MAKYLWGNEPFSMPFYLGTLFTCALALGVVLALAGPEDAVTESSFPAVAALRRVAVVTTAFVFMWYIFLGNQIGINFTEGLPEDVAKDAKHIADRTVANTLEQAIPFLLLLWLEALFVNPRTAMILGWIYVATRFLYPFMFAMYGKFTVLIMVSTNPGYLIIFYFAVSVFFKCAFDIDVHAKIDASSAWWMPLFMVGIMVLILVALLILPKPSIAFIINGVKKEKGGIESDYDEEEDAVE